MGKKARIKKQRQEQSKGAKKLIEQIYQVDEDIAAMEAQIIALEGEKAKVLADLLLENPNPPAHWKKNLLGDVFNDEQMQAIFDILNRPNLDDLAVTKLLKEYLGQFSNQFSAIGQTPDFLAYWVLANKEPLRKMGRESNNRPRDPFTPPTTSRN